MLRCTKFLLLRWMPADGRRIKNHFRAAQRRQSRRFRIPLVPTDADTDLSARGWPSLESEIAGREIEFLVVKRVVGDVHLPIFAEYLSISIENNGGIVVNTGAEFLEKRCDNHDDKLARELTESRCRSSGNFLRQCEVRVIFGLTKILRPEKFGQANDLRALLGRITNEFERAREIFFRLRAALHLHEPDLRHLGLSHSEINHEEHEDLSGFTLCAFVVKSFDRIL